MNATSRLQPAGQPALQLLQRDDCPLCDQALAVLAAARAPELESVWIDHVDELEAAYGMRVPVLRDTVTGAELDWPFDAANGPAAPATDVSPANGEFDYNRISGVEGNPNVTPEFINAVEAMARSAEH